MSCCWVEIIVARRWKSGYFVHRLEQSLYALRNICCDGKSCIMAIVYSEVVEAMQKNHVRLMEHKSYKLMKDGQYIIVSGVRNPFDLKKNGQLSIPAFSGG